MSEAAQMTHRATLEALSGLLMGMFVALLSGTIVSTALKTIIEDFQSDQTAYTWVIAATLLATTVSTPIWGKLADIFSKKLLVQLSLGTFIVGSIAAGLSPNVEFLIGCRVVQGLGAGGIMALVQVVIAAIIPPRERGRYSGYIGATIGLATVSGPLIGGVVAEYLGWRWCFLVGVPLGVVAMLLLHRTLHLTPTLRNGQKIDYLGAALVTSGVSLLLLWITFVGQDNGFPLQSSLSVAVLGTAVALLALAVLAESKVANPMIPLKMFKNSTVSLSVIAGICVGVALFGATVFLAQYFQISRGMSPTLAGLAGAPLIVGLVGGSTVSGRLITKTGRWKRFLVLGSVLLSVGFFAMSFTTATTSYWVIALSMFVVGLGTGMQMQNLILAVQNTVSMKDIGSGSSLVAFFRSLGGAVGVAALGAVLTQRTAVYTVKGFTDAGLPLAPTGDGEEFNLAIVPEPARSIIENAFGLATGDVFLIGVPFALVAFVCVSLIHEVPLRTTNADPIEAPKAPVPST